MKIDAIIILRENDDLAFKRLVDTVTSVINNVDCVKRIIIVVENNDQRILSLIDGIERKSIEIKFISHRELYRNYPGVLPTRSRLSVETMIWFIPGLSEAFLLIEPYCVINRNISSADLFTDYGSIRLKAARRNVRLSALINNFRKNRGAADSTLNLTARLNAAEILHRYQFIDFKRSGLLPLIKNGIITLFENRTGLMEENITYAEDSPFQFCSVELSYLLAEESGKLLLY